MEKFDLYMRKDYPISLLKDEDEGGYVASLPDLKGCLTYGSSKEKSLKNLEDAKAEWLAAALEMGMDIPEPQNLQGSSEELADYLPPGKLE